MWRTTLRNKQINNSRNRTTKGIFLFASSVQEKQRNGEAESKINLS